MYDHAEPTMRIWISGPQGCGKTRVARRLEDVLTEMGFAVNVLDDGGAFGSWPLNGDTNPPLAEIKVEQTK